MWYGGWRVLGRVRIRIFSAEDTEGTEKRIRGSERGRKGARWTALVLACLQDAGATGEGKKALA